MSEPHFLRSENQEEIVAFYGEALHRVMKVGQSLGYTISAYGSMFHDLELIASPWTEEYCRDDRILLRSLQLAACGIANAHYNQEPAKPCGRREYIFAIGTKAFINLSIMPSLTECVKKIEELDSEVNHWRNNHDQQVKRSRILIERTDVPMERVKAYAYIGELLEDRNRLLLELAMAARKNT